MSTVLVTAALLFAFGWSAPSSATVTKAQCDHDYDSCKKKHIFDKKPCRKRRDQCFANLTAQTRAQQAAVVQVRKESTKNKMMGGVTETDKKAEAMRRLKARQQAKATGEKND